ncbi:MAG: S9 family peptidase [Actinomycetia bacterium]|nr:S9 family peptidase [Actinomycetes bacterium]
MARPMTPDDLHELKAVGDVALHPDGVVAVYGITWPDRETDSNRSQLHVHAGSNSRQLTYGHADRAPVFSPDGTRLAFLRSEPKAPPQPMVMAWPGGELTPVEGFPDGVSAICWISDDELLATAPVRPADQADLDDDERARRPRVFTSRSYRFNGRGWTHDRRTHLHRVDLSNGKVTALTEGDVEHRSGAVSPDGKLIASVTATGPDHDLTGLSTVWLHPPGGDARPVTPDGGAWEILTWLPDGRLVGIGTTHGSTVGYARPHLLDLDGGEPVLVGDHDVNAAGVIGPVAGAPVTADAIFTVGYRRGATTVERWGLDGSIETVVKGRTAAGSFAVSPSGERVVTALSSPTRPAELWDVADGDLRRLVTLNEELLAEIDLVEPDEIEVQSADGSMVHALLCSPPASAAAEGPAPGLLYVHGGPQAQYGWGFFDEFQLAAAAGYVVIGGNPRGSDGYGADWARGVVGQLGGGDADDVTALADHLAGRPEVDANRLGLGGGSYGGFMTSWMTAHDHRFKAALVERPVTSWETMVGTSDIGAFFVSRLLDADPTTPEGLETLRHQSPITHAHRCRTPTLIVHSEEDWRCPVEQAEQLFSVYRRIGVEVTFVRFPGENHELTRSGSPRHRIERFGLVHDFFADHLGGQRF